MDFIDIIDLKYLNMIVLNMKIVLEFCLSNKID